MSNKEELIESYFKILKLDSRASQTEVELSYDVLTRGADLPPAELQGYRIAFEYLMTNWFNTPLKPEAEEQGYTRDDFEEEVKEAITHAPEPIKNALSYSDEIGRNLTESSQLIWATQNINAPMLLKALSTTGLHVGDITILTKKDMAKILTDSCLNPIVFYTTTFELTSPLDYNIKDIQMFTKGIKKICEADGKVELTDTGHGVLGVMILPGYRTQQMAQMLRTKCKLFNYSLNLCTDYSNLDEDL